VRYEEIRQLITGSSPDDWAVIESGGGVYLDRLGQVGWGDGQSLEVESHLYLAVFKPDAGVRLAWGVTEDTGLVFDGWEWPDPRIARQVVDGFWHGALVTRWLVLSVDGGRCYLPVPRHAFAGEVLGDGETAGWAVKESEVALARLLQQLARPGDDFGGYLKRTEAIVVPDEDLS
jgi:hypothetical protein